ncbi:PCYCGC motif-containing (lipo)protein [Paenibacillus aurantiacus]|uniref:PCYCGC motif-containing (Lipo)protein n=1 Tax=Paenibacillus aurantiacus TaxID=1936118 RepID=A0ABV5KST7_9BACL
MKRWFSPNRHIHPSIVEVRTEDTSPQQRRKAIRQLLALAGVAAASIAILSACGGGDKNGAHLHGTELVETTASYAAMPGFLKDYTDLTQSLYAQVGSATDIMKQINCYCGCMDDEGEQHDSLYRCYIMDAKEGEITWTNHSASCGICMQELQDIVKLKGEGKSVDEIRQFIDDKYKPSTVS